MNNELLNRLEKLEKSNRKLRAIAIIPSVVMLCLALLAMQDADKKEVITTDTLRAKRIYAEEFVRAGPGGDGGYALLRDGVTGPELEIRGRGTERDTTATMSPSGLTINGHGYRVAMGVSTEAGLIEGQPKPPDGAHVLLSGPPRPGARNPLSHDPSITDLELRKALADLPFTAPRVLLATSVDRGSSIRIWDALHRNRVTLGAQALVEGQGRERQYAEGTMTLWDETGRLQVLLPQR